MELPQIPAQNSPPKTKLTKKELRLLSPKPKAITKHELNMEKENLKFSLLGSVNSFVATSKILNILDNQEKSYKFGECHEAKRCLFKAKDCIWDSYSK